MQELGNRSRLFGVLVTFHRAETLASHTLPRLREQDRRLDHLVVVDNGGETEVRHVLERLSDVAGSVEYVPMPENLGPAGGIAVGMEHVLRLAADDDWMLLVDDDDPPLSTDVVGELERFAHATLATDPTTAGVGLNGARLDWRRGRFVRVHNRELHGRVPVDYLSGNGYPMYRAAAVRAIGTFNRELFWGVEELEFGLRLRRAGYSLYGHGDVWRQGRVKLGRSTRTGQPQYRLTAPDWRRYYTLRNLLHILRTYGRGRTALRVALVAGLGKPLLNLPLSPRLAIRHLSLNWRACRDAWAGRLGRTLAPEAARRSRKRPLG